MQLNEIITLLNAGYTKEEIQALDTPAPAPTPAPEQTPEPEQTPAPEQTPEPAPKQEQPAQPQQPAAQPSEYQQLEGLLKQFISVAQAGNLNAGMNAGVMQQRSAVDILGEVIAPPRKDKSK